MNQHHTLRQQIEAYENGNILDKDCYYFYDWFCQDKSLQRKALVLMAKVKRFIRIVNVDLDKTYVFFKNNCPVYGNLYDDFRICDLEAGDVIYTVAPSLGYTKRKGEAEVWGKANSFREPIVKASSWSELLKKSTIPV
jgi:hypothetical protein